MNRKKELVKEWLHKAKHDLEIAELALKYKPHLTDNICFHCQQAVEKNLKAYLIYLDIDFKRTHDLYYLIDLISERPDFEDKLYNIVDKLQNYSVEIRYPDDWFQPSIEEAKEAFEIAEEFKQIILERIKD